MSLALVTPSYRNDFAIFAELHRSVVRYTDVSSVHYVVVPQEDVELFEPMSGPQCTIVAEESLYPGHYKPLGSLNRILHSLPFVPSHARIAAINVRNPFRPVRGWMIQQALKLELCRQLAVDTVLLVDSDVELVRPISEALLRHGERTRLYRRPREVDARLPTHMEWIRVSRRLLGLPPGSFPAADYISSLCVWEPEIVRAMLARVEQVTGQAWMDAITGQQTFSEWMLYGVFAEEILKYDENAMTDSSLCHSYWGKVPLAPEDAAEFASHIDPDDVAVLIQSKTQTPGTVRRAIMDTIAGRNDSEKRHSSRL